MTNETNGVDNVALEDAEKVLHGVASDHSFIVDDEEKRCSSIDHFKVFTRCVWDMMQGIPEMDVLAGMTGLVAHQLQLPFDVVIEEDERGITVNYVYHYADGDEAQLKEYMADIEPTLIKASWAYRRSIAEALQRA
jgi:hypothetical protein